MPADEDDVPVFVYGHSLTIFPRLECPSTSLRYAQDERETASKTVRPERSGALAERSRRTFQITGVPRSTQPRGGLLHGPAYEHRH